jgi:hypothetical protein
LRAWTLSSYLPHCSHFRFQWCSRLDIHRTFWQENPEPIQWHVLPVRCDWSNSHDAKPQKPSKRGKMKTQRNSRRKTLIWSLAYQFLLTTGVDGTAIKAGLRKVMDQASVIECPWFPKIVLGLCVILVFRRIANGYKNIVNQEWFLSRWVRRSHQVFSHNERNKKTMGCQEILNGKVVSPLCQKDSKPRGKLF